MKVGSVFKRSMILSLSLSLLWIYSAEANVLDDPTRPPGYPRYQTSGKIKQGPSWRVNAIYIGANEKKAMINGKILRTGETINGAKVTQILPSEVQLRKNRKSIVLQLNSSPVKKIYRDN